MTPDISCRRLTHSITNSKMADKMAACQGMAVSQAYFIASGIAYCISPYASFYAGLSCYIGDEMKVTLVDIDEPGEFKVTPKDTN